MKNLLQDTIRKQLIKSRFKRHFDISKEINAEYGNNKKTPCELEVERLLEKQKKVYIQE